MKPCREWPGGASSSGYCNVKRDGVWWLVHRYEWTQAHGPIPDGLVINHLCRNKKCYELTHLEAVTQAENVRHGFGWQGETCRQGHVGMRHTMPCGKNICRGCRADAKRRYRERTTA